MKDVFEAIKKHLNENGLDCVRRIDSNGLQHLRLRDKNHKKYGDVLVEKSQGGSVMRLRYKTKSRNNGHSIIDMADPKSLDKLTSLAKSKRVQYEAGYSTGISREINDIIQEARDDDASDH